MNALKENITADYGEDVVEFVAIPTNNFGLQEPGSNAEIPLGLRYVRPGGDFIPNYKLTMKNNANGADRDPLFSFLTDACLGTGELIGDPTAMYWNPVRMHDLTWNFEKFLITPEGKPVKRYSPPESPDNLYDDIIALIPDEVKQRRLDRLQKTKVEKPKLELYKDKKPAPYKTSHKKYSHKINTILKKNSLKRNFHH